MVLEHFHGDGGSVAFRVRKLERATSEIPGCFSDCSKYCRRRREGVSVRPSAAACTSFCPGSKPSVGMGTYPWSCNQSDTTFSVLIPYSSIIPFSNQTKPQTKPPTDSPAKPPTDSLAKTPTKPPTDSQTPNRHPCETPNRLLEPANPKPRKVPKVQKNAGDQTM